MPISTDEIGIFCAFLTFFITRRVQFVMFLTSKCNELTKKCNELIPIL